MNTFIKQFIIIIALFKLIGSNVLSSLLQNKSFGGEKNLIIPDKNIFIHLLQLGQVKKIKFHILYLKIKMKQNKK